MVHWQKLGTQEVLTHPRMQLVEDTVLLQNGQQTEYLREVNKPDYVTIIARRDAKVAMVYDYSYPNDDMLLQFPEGVIDDKETPEQCGIRELREEAGLLAGVLRSIGKNLHNQRRSTAQQIVLVADQLKEVPQEHEAEESGMSLVWLAEQEVWDKIAAGEIKQKNTLAAWTIYAATQHLMPEA